MNAVTMVREIASEARSRFVDRDDAIEVMSLGMVSGHNAIMLGPPGTGKSAIARFFCESSGLSFFRKLLNPDTTRDELVGPIDPHKLSKGEWDRKWNGLATNDVAFLDEVGKAGSQVQDMLLDAMEERKVTGSVDKDIPLHMVVSASNEAIESPAVWDRFTLRVMVNPIGSARNLKDMLFGCGQREDKSFRRNISRDELREMREEVKKRAGEASEEVLNTIAELWSNFDSVSSSRPSDRRWLRLLEIAAAKSMLDGQDHMQPKHLMVGVFILWDNPEDIRKIKHYVSSVVDKEAARVEATIAAIEELILITPINLEQTSKAIIKMNKLIRIIEGDSTLKGNPKIASHVVRLRERQAQIENSV